MVLGKFVWEVKAFCPHEEVLGWVEMFNRTGFQVLGTGAPKALDNLAPRPEPKSLTWQDMKSRLHGMGIRPKKGRKKSG